MASLNAYSPSNTYTLATIFSLYAHLSRRSGIVSHAVCSAHPYGTPTILSSYSNFFDTNAGSPNGGTTTCSCFVSFLPSHPLSGVRLNFLRHGKLLSHRQGTELVRGKSIISDRDNCHDTMTYRFCQHRWPAIAGMVGFRNNVGSAPLTRWVSPSSQQIAFARGTYQHLLFL